MKRVVLISALALSLGACATNRGPSDGLLHPRAQAPLLALLGVMADANSDRTVVYSPGTGTTVVTANKSPGGRITSVRVD